MEIRLLSRPAHKAGATGLMLLAAAVASAHGQVRIFDIQGSGASSPLAGRHVRRVPGRVTYLSHAGFYMQDPEGDGRASTSDGLFVYTHDRPAVQLGERVRVSGTVHEYTPSAAGSNNLSITEIHTGRVAVVPGASAPRRIQPVIIGRGGRTPPTRDIAGPVPGSGGIAFYESLEGMRVTVEHPQIVGPGNRPGQAWVVADNGAGATGMNPSGGITLRADGRGVDYNPERICIRFPSTTALNVGTRLGSVSGVISYAGGHYVLLADHHARVRTAPPRRRATNLRSGARALTVATYNVENLAPDSGKYAALARQIVGLLQAPDILALEEIQDDDGDRDSGQTGAGRNLARLEAAIRRAGGPAYRAETIDPLNDHDGGEPGSNIRQAILYNPLRVSPAPPLKGRGSATAATRASVRQGQVALTLNPGRIEPRAGAFSSSRKPLAAAFDFRGRRIIVVANHFTSKWGSTTRYGRRQPPLDAGERQRMAQARILRRFAKGLLRARPDARLIVLGDFNDFGFMPPLRLLDEGPGAPLYDLLDELPAVQRYTYVFQGNSQALDHILVSRALRPRARVQIVHVNAEFAHQVSDHDPVIARLALPE